MDEILEEYVGELRISGNPDEDIRNYLISTIVGHKRKLERVQIGEQDLHRDGKSIRKITIFKKLENKDSWYCKQSRKETPYIN